MVGVSAKIKNLDCPCGKTELWGKSRTLSRSGFLSRSLKRDEGERVRVSVASVINASVGLATC